MLRSSFDQPFRLGRKTVRGRILIPSGIRCTHAATIRKCFLEVPSIGVVTTKSISARPRKGYREPIYARYAPGCYINAVGLANPGAEQFVAEFEGIEIPGDKFLLVSIFGSDVESFVEAARTLKPIADGFELNMSCPHAKGYGAEVGQDTELLRRITEAVVRIAEAPVFVKLSAMLPNLAGTATAAVSTGVAGITVTNTIGPALVAVGADPILHNRLGGLSGDGIRPLGLRAVEQVRQAVGEEPVIIGMGGIASAEHVRQYALAGADLFGIGSALTGLDSVQFREYLAQLQRDACGGHGQETCRRTCESPVPMDYVKARIGARVDYNGSLFKLILESLPGDYRDGDLAGKFFFLCCPGVGEKPFAIFSASEKSVIVRTVGEFTQHLAGLSAGAEILLRGPYGRGVPRFEDSTLVHVGGGTGTASLLEIAHRLGPGNRQVFLLGARTREHLFDVDRFERLGPVFLSTDDGSLGRRGFVPELLPEVVAGIPAAERQRIAFINCGPEPMVRRCFEIQQEMVSEDRILGAIEYMTSCGVGICGKCSSPSGALSCIDGPFMPWREFQPGARQEV
ncbi:MAG: tRNA-dihydrouridine synthase [Bryobacteraceae bacterium]|jgi:dihydroorotate dehydrogenase (NAD+) catalytic subunit